MPVLRPASLWPPEALEDQNRLAQKPNLTIYIPDSSKATGAAIIVCPGGGYSGLSEKEGDPVAEWLAKLGITAFVLRYRTAPHFRHPAMLDDLSQAIRQIRAGAVQYRLDVNRIGVMGFSAGGHLAATLATHFEPGKISVSDPLAQYSSRPDLAVLIYPVVTLQPPFGHIYSRQSLLGDNPEPNLEAFLSNNLQVTENTPPMFLVHASNDEIRCENSLLMALALSAKGIACELHLYEKGGHGFALAEHDPILQTWLEHFEKWLVRQGWLTRPNMSEAVVKDKVINVCSKVGLRLSLTIILPFFTRFDIKISYRSAYFGRLRHYDIKKQPNTLLLAVQSCSLYFGGKSKKGVSADAIFKNGTCF